ncbi:unnamed protein product [Porites lobata]|uniref:protein kinase C n=1 Tax=Porites lobata TaxID=104759 RepID=A0ABN8P7Z1_9CNID|nr:unnamed protein product [Porites lobata]
MTEDGPRRSRGITLQCGLARETYGFEGKDLNALKELACSFLDQKFSDHSCIGIADKVILFVHNYSSTNILEKLTSVEQLNEASVIEVVVSAKVPEDETIIRPHLLTVHSYRSPTFCDFCGQMLFGLVKQGLKCEGCGGNYHKKCAYKIPNNCSDSRHRTSSTIVNSPSNTNTLPRPSSQVVDPVLLQHSNSLNDSMPSLKERRATWSGRSVWIEPALSGRIQVPHSFAIHSYKRPTNCQICKRLLRGLFRQGLQCKDCKFNCHRRCAEKAPKNCRGEVAMIDTASLYSTDSSTISESFSEMDLSHDMTYGEHDEYECEVESASRSNQEEICEPPSPSSPDSDQQQLTPTISNNIPLQRIVVSVKHTKRKGSKVLKQGWMVHFTNKDMQRRRHYWRLDTKCLTLFKDSTSSRYYKEIQLSEILSVDSNIDPLATDATRAPHCFEMKTRDMVYYVGQVEDENETPDPDSGIGTVAGQAWAHVTRSALMPGCVTPTTSSAPGSTAAVNNTDVEMEVTQEEERPKDSHTDISHLYQVFPDEILGSGQFGIVYGGVHRESGRDVAIKVIDKLRFPTKQEAQLKNEFVFILQHVKHPGVVGLEKMFETPERVFVVMEKMKSDMLELILSSPKGRLDERFTKFLITQILVALKDLHARNIVHCDLKPENVLLSSVTNECGYPQIKLCDFGFARIIEEKSFRRSVVGTPAYLAPEVLLNKGYNRSLDMWSVGVVLYVSLSGTFPFNEEEDIQDQIHNAEFMYPSDPWLEISANGIDLIKNLLQLQQRCRFTCDKSLIHAWLQDFQTWLDLRSLEGAVGERYLTHESDDARWQEYSEQLQASQHREPARETTRPTNNRFFPPMSPTERRLQTSISFL